MNGRIERESWLAWSLLLSCVLLLAAGTVDAAVSKPAPAPEATDGKLRIICFDK